MDSERTSLRMNLIKQRVSELRHQQISRSFIGLSVVCILLSAFLVNIFNDTSGDIPSKLEVNDIVFGTILLENAGGYVLVAVIAFIFGVIMAGICLYLKEKRETGKKTDPESQRQSNGSDGFNG